MKGKIALCSVVLLAVLAVVGVAYAHGSPPLPPIEPTCPTGQVTVTPAIWVPESWTCPVGYEEHDGHCRQWHDTSHWDYGTTCPVNYHYHNNGNVDQRCHRDNNTIHPEHKAPLMDVWHVEGHWNTIDMTHVEGYWLPPVCRAPILGCTDQEANNYNPLADIGDETCTYDMCQWHPEIHAHDEDCIPIVGCMDPDAVNYNPEATVEGTCLYPPDPIPGCTDPEAVNYDPEATVDDQSCEYPPVCMDEAAQNYGMEGECVFPEPPQYCAYTVTTYWRCFTGNVIWSQETGVTSGEGSNFIGSAPYNRICEWCGDINPSIYHREWRNDCDGNGWDEGTWDLPEWLHTLGGCPLGGRCIG